MAKETFTLAEVRQLIAKNVPRYSQVLKSHDNSGFAMGERNMAKIIDSFLEHHGNVSYHSGGMISVEHVTRNNL